ncbi:MAG: (2Fe-2S)-binding protein [Rhodothalassiaceae bacterium]
MAATRFRLNGRSVETEEPPGTPLLWVVRDRFGLTGTKFGCGIGQCGACTVHVDGYAMRACVTPIGTVADKDITTIEGLSETGAYPLQKAWIAHQVPQCGYCQSGQIMAAASLLADTPDPTEDQITEALTGNLCRCMAYPRIRRAVLAAAAELRGETSDA